MIRDLCARAIALLALPLLLSSASVARAQLQVSWDPGTGGEDWTIALDPSSQLVEFFSGGASSKIQSLGLEWTLSPASYLYLAPGIYGDRAFMGALGAQSVFLSDDVTLRYVTHYGGSGLFASHIWHVSSEDNADRLMMLEAVDEGDLSIGGQLTQNTVFGIAESFWEAAEVTPGQLVAVDPADPLAVRPTGGAYERAVLGVAGERPAIILGGGAFSTAALRRTWGDEIAEEYERSRPELELRVFAERPELRAAAEDLRSPATFLSAAGGRGARHPSSDYEPSEEQVAGAYERALEDHEQKLLDATLDSYFEERFTAVALAGRVRVQADASFGDIAPGDALTSSPVPGVAMRAAEPGPIVGTALEGLSGGAGSIWMLVHRGWNGTADRRSGFDLAPTARDGRDREIAELRRQLALLRERIDLLTAGPSPTLRLSSTP